MKLNSAKYVFGVESKKFLGFQVSQRGIEANPDKIKALLDMSSPRTIKEIQCLTARVAALGRFISRVTDKCLPFIQQLKGHKKAEWTLECKQVFQQRSSTWVHPLLSKPEEGEPLFLYLTVSASVVSLALIREFRNKQYPVYYVSKAMVPVEIRYPSLEKLALSLVVSARRLRPYFQAHSIVVLTDSPLRQVLQRPEVSGLMTKWAIELGEFDIQFCSRTAIKGQAVANFIAEFTTTNADEIGTEVEMTPPVSLGDQKAILDKGWVLHVDGSSNVKGVGAGIILVAFNSTIIQYAIRFEFKALNNEAEYEALLAGLMLAASLGVQSLQVRCDSQLVVNHIFTKYEAKETRMISYLDEIPRVENSWADTLARLASAAEGKIPRFILVEFIEHPSIGQSERVNPVHITLSWMDPIFNYLTSGEIPPDKLEARRLRVRAARYVVLDGILYKKGHSQPYLRCLQPDEADYVIREIYEGICGNHSGGRALALKILRQGYFWPTLKQDSKDYVQKCDKCQRYAAVPRQLAKEMTPMNGPWPFAQWGIDIIGHLPTGKGQVKFTIIAVNYFTNWADAKPIAKITEQKVIDFV
ncbi:uncharacterized protein LOC131220168 [Magnolia sinica]|uniref:uncharacterized protein LOC131220168 n=1 Tax=Magnolia sinica TaxID=86752 RepID=UPI002657F1B5|nr:uncharacterized protein LOC131220168 [Magnolia sinica]